MIIVREVIKDVVAKVSLELTPKLALIDPLITGVHFMAGHPIEVVNRLIERDRNDTFKYMKYPLIALFMDFPENYGRLDDIMEVDLHLVIARATGRNLLTDDRFDLNFKPFLYPIYESFKNNLHTFSYGKNGKPFNTASAEKLKHTKIDRPFWGRETFLKNEVSTFTDYIDAIEIRDLKLLVNLKHKKEC